MLIPVLGYLGSALATLAFALFFDAVLVNLSWIGTPTFPETTVVPRPQIGPLDFGNDKTFLALAVVVFTITALAVIALRGGTMGRTLWAVRGSELAAASIGEGRARAALDKMIAISHEEIVEEDGDEDGDSETS